MKRLWVITIVIASTAPLALANAPVAPAEIAAAEDAALQAAARKVAPAVVRIETLGGEAAADTEAAGPTSGVILTPDGHIIASGFAFADKEKPASILVTLADGKRLAGRLVARDGVR